MKKMRRGKPGQELLKIKNRGRQLQPIPRKTQAEAAPINIHSNHLIHNIWIKWW